MTPEEIPVYDQPINILVSGGTDSALLLYFLMKKYTTQINIHTITNSKKSLYNTYSAVAVVSKCIELTSNDNITHSIYHKISQQDKDFHSIAGTGKTFIGITSNPPKEVEKTFLDRQNLKSYEIRNPDVIKDETPNSNFVLPWINVNKKQIAEFYRQYDNLIDTLFPITRSCEWVPGTEVPNPKNGHCGKCWWCEERKWGFGKL